MPRFISIFSSLFVLILLSCLALAGIPRLINYQGMLTDNSGTPLTGSYNLTFKIWTDTTGGSSLWDETHSVQVQNGLYNVILGQMTALNLPFDQQYWLEVIVGAEIMPRIKFTSVGYAYRALVADSAEVTGSGVGGWVDDGTVVRLATNTDNVGIGTTAPTTKLHLKGEYYAFLKFDHSRDTTWVIGSSSFDNQSLSITQSYSGGGILCARFYPGSNISLAPVSGYVGVGTLNPKDDLHVADHIRIGEDFSYPTVYGELKHDGGGTGFVINANAGGGWADMHFQTDGTTRMFIESAGNVGIGTTSPGYKLDVAGPAHATSFPTSSDARLKKDVTQLSHVLEKLEKIRGVSFEWNELYESMDRSTGHREIGVIAQEVEAVFPELVSTWGEEEYRAVDYGRLTGVLIEAIKELKAKNEELQQRIEILEVK